MCALTCIGSGLVVYAPAAAASPAGTIVLASGQSGTPTALTVLGASPSYVVYRAGSVSSGQLETVPVTGGPSVVMAGALSDGYGVTLVGSLVTSIGYDDVNDTDAIYFEHADGTGSGSVDVPAGYRELLSGSSDGEYVSSHNSNGNIEISDLTTTGSVNPLAELPHSANSFPRAVSDESGTLIDYEDSRCTDDTEDLVFVPAAGGTPTTLVNGSPCNSTSIFDSAIGGGNAAWALDNESSNTATFADASTGGGSTHVITLPSDANPQHIAITSTEFGYVTDAQQFATIPVTGGSATVASYAVASDGGLESNPSVFAFARLDSPSTAGIYTTPDASTAPTKIVSDDTDPISATAVYVAPGQVGYSDNGTPTKPIYSRSLTTSGDTLTAGPESLVASSSTGYGLSLSGTRTAYSDDTTTNGNSLELAVRGGAVKTLSSAHTTPEYDNVVENYSQLSGRHVLYPVFTGDGRGYELYDDVTSTATAVPGPSALGSIPTHALWGNYLVSLTNDGAVERENISSGQTTTLYQIPVPTGDHASGTVAAWGNTVAWSSCVYDPSSGGCESTNNGYLTVAPGTSPGPPTSFDAPAGSTLALSNGYLAYDNSNGSLVALPLGGGSPISISTTACYPSEYTDSFSVDASTIAWLDCQNSDSYSSAGTPQAAPLPHVSNAPWFLGDPQAPTAYATSSGSWNAEFVMSAAMTQCDVAISAGGSTVATLPCDPDNAALGDAAVTWDGTNASGDPVSPGIYRWTVEASNSDGPLLNDDGSSSPVTGTITVDGGGGGGGSTPTVPDAPSSPSAQAGNGQVTLSWSAPKDDGGAPITAYDVESSTDGGTTWTPATTHERSAMARADDTSPPTSRTITGLENGTAYVFRVAAVNSAGVGAYSSASLPVTPSAHSATLTIHGDKLINAGSSVDLATTLSDATTTKPISGASVELLDRATANDRWRVARSTTTDSAGAASISVAPSVNTQYEWYFAGGDGVGSAESPTKAIAVRQVVTAALTKHNVVRGGTIEVYGTVVPGRAGQVVKLQQRTHGTWVSAHAHANTSKQKLPNGVREVGFVISRTAHQVGQLTLRVVANATKRNAAGHSGRLHVTVT